MPAGKHPIQNIEFQERMVVFYLVNGEQCSIEGSGIADNLKLVPLQTEQYAEISSDGFITVCLHHQTYNSVMEWSREIPATNPN